MFGLVRLYLLKLLLRLLNAATANLVAIAAA